MNEQRKPRLILASSSPRRQQLLRQAGVKFDVIVPAIPEPRQVPVALTPAQHAEALAYFKARDVADRQHHAWILGADTLVALADQILGKASNADEARQMLQTLSSARHQVITGIALLGPDQQRLIASATTFVTMRPMRRQEIEAYIQSGEWKGKAGAYAIQETADRFIEKLEGSFTNVVGLPMELMFDMLQELEMHPEAHKAV